jgi:hypothetical protein
MFMHEITKQGKDTSYLTPSYSTQFSGSLPTLGQNTFLYILKNNNLFNHFLKTKEKFKINYQKRSLFLYNDISL